MNELKDEYINLNSKEYRKKIEPGNRFFYADTSHHISVKITEFSKNKARINIVFSYGQSLWHNYYVLLKNYLVERSKAMDNIFYLKQDEKNIH
ncbi:MAG: hypothetical protein IPJ81_14145 [Chitinophagaceae bacterium]|nr:hypothetical protein [Chitinophagaceae bacterium]